MLGVLGMLLLGVWSFQAVRPGQSEPDIRLWDIRRLLRLPSNARCAGEWRRCGVHLWRTVHPQGPTGLPVYTLQRGDQCS